MSEWSWLWSRRGVRALNLPLPLREIRDGGGKYHLDARRCSTTDHLDIANTYLGDAAHPMYPISSNGASQAILDAACLTDSLLKWRSGDIAAIPAALQAYRDERLPITAKTVMANGGNGPDQVLQVAHERAPDGFQHINDMIACR